MLLDWLNNEVKLSRKVIDIVEDMSNGYLIGEILNKHKQISNFFEYKDKIDSDTKIHNFRLIEKALRDLEIKVVWKSLRVMIKTTRVTKSPINKKVYDLTRRVH